MSDSIFHLTTEQWASLTFTVVIIAGALLLENLAFGWRQWPERWYYAMGIITDAGGLLAWAALYHITITWQIALILILCASLAGVPDWFLLRHQAATRAQQDETRQRAWNQLATENRQLAGQLALFQIVGNGHRYSRAHDLMESVLFLRGGIRQDLADMQLMVQQLEPLLDTILNPNGGNSQP